MLPIVKCPFHFHLPTKEEKVRRLEFEKREKMENTSEGEASELVLLKLWAKFACVFKRRLRRTAEMPSDFLINKTARFLISLWVGKSPSRKHTAPDVEIWNNVFVVKVLWSATRRTAYKLPRPGRVVTLLCWKTKCQSLGNEAKL